MLRSQDILLVLKIVALSDARDRTASGFGGGSGSGAGGEDGTGFGGSYQESLQVEVRLKSGLPVSFARLGGDIGISASQAHASAVRAVRSGLLREDYSVRRRAIHDALLCVGYYFPTQRGGLERGIPTAYAAPPLAEALMPSAEPPPVWPYAEGKVRGLACEPIYKTAPVAALQDRELYEYLALVDTLRIGRAREVELARSELARKLDLQG